MQSDLPLLMIVFDIHGLDNPFIAKIAKSCGTRHMQA